MLSGGTRCDGAAIALRLLALSKQSAASLKATVGYGAGAALYPFSVTCSSQVAWFDRAAAALAEADPETAPGPTEEAGHGSAPLARRTPPSDVP